MSGRVVRRGRGGWRIGLLPAVALLAGASPAASLDSTDFTGDIEAPQVRSFTMVGEDGGIFSYGDVPFRGSLGASPPAAPIVAVAAV